MTGDTFIFSKVIKLGTKLQLEQENFGFNFAQGPRFSVLGFFSEFENIYTWDNKMYNVFVTVHIFLIIFDGCKSITQNGRKLECFQNFNR